MTSKKYGVIKWLTDSLDGYNLPIGKFLFPLDENGRLISEKKNDKPNWFQEWWRSIFH